MATRYWVGGSGTWNSTNTTNWSATSGGAGGASVPTSADDVIINANSGPGASSYSITCSSAVCATLTTSSTSPKIVTLSGTLTVSGNTTIGSYVDFSGLTCNLTPSLAAGLNLGGTNTVFGGTFNFNTNVTYTLTNGTAGTYNPITFNVNAGTINGSFGNNGTNILTVAGGTVTTGGTNFAAVTVSSGTLTLSSALTCTTMTLTGGTLAKATFTLTCTTSLTCTGTTARAISGTTAGATTVLSGAGTVFSCANATNLTLTNPQTYQCSSTADSYTSLVTI